MNEQQVNENVEAVTEETLDFVDKIVITQLEDQFIVERINKDGEVTGNDPVADPTMLDVINKAKELIDERITYLKTRNAAYEGHMMAVQEMYRQQAVAAQMDEAAVAQVEMPE